MAQQDYQPFVERMINRYEGGYGWNRNDPGGPTKDGITCYDLAEFMHQPMDSMVRWAPIVKAMTLVTADQIYDQKYATACAFNALNVGCDCVVFDFGVNSGPSRAIRHAQAIVGVGVDGILGSITLAAINAYDPIKFVDALCDSRLTFLHGLNTWSEFGVGWTSRVMDLRAYSSHIINPPKAVPESPYVEKVDRIPLAYAKGYAPEDVR